MISYLYNQIQVGGRHKHQFFFVLIIYMPYKLQKSGKGYYVVNIDTNKKYSNKPISKSNAEKQMKILNDIYEKELKKIKKKKK